MHLQSPAFCVPVKKENPVSDCNLSLHMELLDQIITEFEILFWQDVSLLVVSLWNFPAVLAKICRQLKFSKIQISLHHINPVSSTEPEKLIELVLSEKFAVKTLHPWKFRRKHKDNIKKIGAEFHFKWVCMKTIENISVLTKKFNTAKCERVKAYS